MCKPKADGGMGFKDLKAFNLALLAISWRLSQNPSSLAYRVLKARYFPGSNFMEAQLGKRLSYTWRSLMAAKKEAQPKPKFSCTQSSESNVFP